MPSDHDAGEGNPTAVPTGRDLLPLLFGATERDELTGLQLVALLGDLGIGASSARTFIARTVGWGGLAVRRIGRQAAYRPAPSIRAAFEALRERAGPADRWSGSFHALLYTVPESERRFRDHLRSFARQAGYGAVRPGLMLHPEDRWSAVAGALPPLPPGSTLHTGWLTLSPETGRAVVAETWDLEELASTYRRQQAELEREADRADAELERGVEGDGSTPMLRRYVTAVRPIFQTLYRDPNLPRQLLPADWPREQATAALGPLVARYGPRMQARLAEIG